jgi:hypothetical protein
VFCGNKSLIYSLVICVYFTLEINSLAKVFLKNTDEIRRTKLYSVSIVGNLIMKFVSVLFFILFLFLEIPVLDARKNSLMWSHLKIDIDNNSACPSSSLIPKWIIDNQQIKYCVVLLDENRKNSLDTLRLQIEHAIGNWLSSINQYGFDVYKGRRRKINLARTQIMYQANCVNDGNTLVFLFIEEGRSLYGCNQNDINKLQGEAKKTMDKLSSNPFITISSYYPDTILRMKRNFKDNPQQALRDGTLRASKDINYTSKEFCNDYLAPLTGKDCSDYTTFNVIMHELGHAFGLSDEYGNDVFKDTKFRTEISYLSKSIMRDCNRLWPTCDDVQGLVFMFDRLSRYKRGETTDICPWRKGKYLNGLPNGEWKYHNPNTNKLEWIINYNLGERHGLSLLYFQGEENFSFCSIYNNDKECGLWYEYDVNGFRRIYLRKTSCPQGFVECPLRNR